MRHIEVQTLAEFDERAHGATTMRGWQVQDVDLSDRAKVLLGLDATGALFLGCRFPDDLGAELRRRGALVFPEVPDVPFDAYRSSLYTPAELYDGLDKGYDDTPDAIVYAWSMKANSPRLGGTSVHDSLAMALHDNAIDDALAEFASGRSVVGIMGGHEVQRGEPRYEDAARLGRELAEQGLTVATGGGPGAMEAANLGASMAGASDDDLCSALRTVGTVASYSPSVTDWAQAGFAAGIDPTDHSLGIPTWFYGHEPPNPFCGRIAKYFRNAIREDVLLHLCRSGVVFLPGSAGTVQEIFQAACEIFYAGPDPSSPAPGEHPGFTPMVLVGEDYWSSRLPAWPLVRALGDLRSGFGSCLRLVDRPDQVAAALGNELGGRPG